MQHSKRSYSDQNFLYIRFEETWGSRLISLDDRTFGNYFFRALTLTDLWKNWHHLVYYSIINETFPSLINLSWYKTKSLFATRLHLTQFTHHPYFIGSKNVYFSRTLLFQRYIWQIKLFTLDARKQSKVIKGIGVFEALRE